MPAECSPPAMQFARLDGRAVVADFGGGLMISARAPCCSAPRTGRSGWWIVSPPASRPGCAPLAGKSTLNRLEHALSGAHRYRRIGHDGGPIETLFVDLFLDTHRQAPEELILDLDATDDRLHGRREGRFFHG